jgi:hypothetical protein
MYYSDSMLSVEEKERLGLFDEDSKQALPKIFHLKKSGISIFYQTQYLSIIISVFQKLCKLLRLDILMKFVFNNFLLKF